MVRGLAPSASLSGTWRGSGVFFKQPKTQPVPAPSRIKELRTVHGAAEKDSRPLFDPPQATEESNVHQTLKQAADFVRSMHPEVKVNVPQENAGIGCPSRSDRNERQRRYPRHRFRQRFPKFSTGVWKQKQLLSLLVANCAWREPSLKRRCLLSF